MSRISYSYQQELKEQIDERLAAITRIHRADLVDGTHRGARRRLSSRMGGALIRLGTWLEGLAGRSSTSAAKEWRASLKDAESGERIGLADLEQLFTYLRLLTNDTPDARGTAITMER